MHSVGRHWFLSKIQWPVQWQSKFLLLFRTVCYDYDIGHFCVLLHETSSKHEFPYILNKYTHTRCEYIDQIQASVYVMYCR